MCPRVTGAAVRSRRMRTRVPVAQRSLALLTLLCGCALWVSSSPARSAATVAQVTARDEPGWLCRARGRVVLHTTAAGVVYFRLPEYPDSRFACVRGKRWAFAFSVPRDGTNDGTADLQFAGPFMTLQVYGGGCSNNGACEGPKAWLIDLRRLRPYPEPEVGISTFRRVVRLRANAAGDAAMIVRDSPGEDRDPGYPAGPGPFRIDIRDRNGRRTIDRGPGIDPGSLNVTGRRVTWLHDGTPRTTMLARRPTRSG